LEAERKAAAEAEAKRQEELRLELEMEEAERKRVAEEEIKRKEALQKELDALEYEKKHLEEKDAKNKKTIRWALGGFVAVMAVVFIIAFSNRPSYSDFSSPSEDDDEMSVAQFLGYQGSENGHQWVDLGLSVKWATCNVGAPSPDEPGDYFAWGELSPKSDYSWDSYKWRLGSSDKLKKYGNADRKTSLEVSDDAARYNWGGSWRMPSSDEWLELYVECTWSWVVIGGKNGYLVKGDNGNSIFLPAAGSYYETSLSDVNSYGYYLSSTRIDTQPYLAGGVHLSSDDIRLDGGLFRSNGFSIRPVAE